ncbi:MAG: imidazole glycerol phosphate synthase subunit HisF [Clostridiales bacterium]|jgi:cyclase|nr:imidazole glycerol phosphate synthase subunit HisF [Clostridiales bacterium]
MNYVRIIPCLDIFKGRVVKGVNFKNIRDAGDPVEIAAAYSQSGADELVFLDISASNEDRGILLDLVKETAKQVTIPFTVGGGIKSLEDMEAVFNAGADKISVNSAAVRRPELISEAAKRFGSERIIVAIDAKRNLDGSYEVYIGGGNIKTGRDAIEWSKEAEQRGAGEILLTSMDTDGTKDGYDLSLLKTATQAVQIPVTASGGAGRLEHFAQAVTKGGARGLLAASLFHYGELTVIDVKNYLKEKGIRVRLETCL